MTPRLLLFPMRGGVSANFLWEVVWLEPQRVELLRIVFSLRIDMTNAISSFSNVCFSLECNGSFVTLGVFFSYPFKGLNCVT